MEILDHLIHEHREVESMLDELAESEPGPERRELVARLDESLRTHMAMEERFVYPIVKDVLGDDEEVEAENEHELTREGLEKLREMAGEPGFAAAVDMVKAGVSHHVHDEEEDVFPELEKDASDRLQELGDPDALQEQVRAGAAGDGHGETRDELYRQAKQAGIPGRSSMSKDELERALHR